MQRRSLIRLATGAAVLGAADVRPLRAQPPTKFKFKFNVRRSAAPKRPGSGWQKTSSNFTPAR